MSEAAPVERHVRIARAGSFGDDTPQTAGLVRNEAFDARNDDGEVLSAFRSWVAPGAATGAHHHGPQETILYVIEGRARYRWGPPARARGRGRAGRLRVHPRAHRAPGDQRVRE